MTEDQLLKNIIPLYERDIDRLFNEVSLYQNDRDLWKLAEGIKNPGGNLCLHLCGNLSYYIGNVIGHQPYQRNRELEFAAKDIPKSVLLEKVTETRHVVMNGLKNLTTDTLYREYPEMVFSYPMTTLYFLLHLLAHLSYHLGQLNYHRRLFSSSN